MKELTFETPINLDVQKAKTTTDIYSLVVTQFHVETEFVYGDKILNAPTPVIGEVHRVTLVASCPKCDVPMRDVLLNNQAQLKTLLDMADYDDRVEAIFNAAKDSGDYNS